MDLLSHGLLGAATAQAGAPARDVRIATGVGFAAALLPDVDALVHSAADPLLTLELHRHFTHSLIFIPVGALVAALLLWPFLRRRLPFAKLYLYALLGYALAGLLDAATSYGTHLLWPFSDARTAWSVIAVVDPLFTLVLAVPVIAGWFGQRPLAGRVALALAAAYLALGAMQHQRALAVSETLAAARGHVPERVEVKPTMGNLLLWRSMYVAEGHVHVDGVRVGVGEPRIYAGATAPLLRPAQATEVPAGSTARRDIERFAFFSEDLLIRDRNEPHLIVDARYSMLPNELAPMWAIRIDPERPERHADFVVERPVTPEIRQRFIDMLRGRD